MLNIKKSVDRVMIFKIDIDGVIRDIYTPMLNIYNEHYNQNLSIEDIIDYDVDKVFKKTKEIDNKSAVDFFFKEHAIELFFDSKPYDGIKEALKKVRENGHKIIITTWQFTCENKVLTLLFLKKNEIPYDDICFTKDKWIVHSDVIIDDNPEFILNKNERSTFQYLIDKPYNRGIDTSKIPSLHRSDSLISTIENFL